MPLYDNNGRDGALYRSRAYVIRPTGRSYAHEDDEYPGDFKTQEEAEGWSLYYKAVLSPSLYRNFSRTGLTSAEILTRVQKVGKAGREQWQNDGRSRVRDIGTQPTKWARAQALLNELWPEDAPSVNPNTEMNVNAMMNHPANNFHGCYAPDLDRNLQFAGVALWQQEENRIFLYYLGVHRFSRRRKLGQFLIQYIRNRNPTLPIVLFVKNDNASGIAFYTRLHFRVTNINIVDSPDDYEMTLNPLQPLPPLN